MLKTAKRKEKIMDDFIKERINLEEVDSEEETKMAFDSEISLELQETDDINKEKPDDEIMLAEETMPLSAHALNEEVALRQENVKVFSMSDGTKKAVFYSEPVHVYDEEKGRFVELDNSFSEYENGRYYKNKKGAFDVKFSADGGTDEIFTAQKGEYKVVMSLSENTKSAGAAAKASLEYIDEPVLIRESKFAGAIKSAELDTNVHSAAELSTAEDVISTKQADEYDTPGRQKVVFCNMLQNADCEYEISGGKIKEDIVVKEKSDTYRYSFNIDCENLAMELSDAEKTVSFKSTATNEEIFHIPAPFMTDAAGTRSDGVIYEVVGNKLSIIADSEWINSEERTLPVVIDPQLVLSSSSSYITTYYRACNSNCLVQSSFPEVGACGNCNGNAGRTYIKINIPNMPRNPRINNAELTLFQRSATNPYAGVTGPKIGLYQVDNINAGYYTSSCENFMDFETVNAGYIGAEYTFDITALFETATSAETGQANAMLKLLDESNACTCVSLFGSGTNISEYAPILTVTYESTYGFDTLSNAPSHDLGRLGKGLVDLQKGKLAIESEDFSWKGKKMPVNIKHYYNGSLSDVNYTKNAAIGLNVADFSSMSVGKGWSLNWMQSMVPVGTADDGYLYTGNLGEEIFFKPEMVVNCDTANGQCCEYYIYKDINGYGYTYDNCEKKLYMDGFTYQFDGAGRLIKLSDKYNNSNELTYTAGKLTSISDGAGRLFELNYSADGNLTSITAPNNSVISYSYNNGYLNEVVYPNGQKAEINYGGPAGRPSQVMLKDENDANLYKITYTYLADHAGNKINRIQEYGYDGTTEVIGRITHYSYNTAGRRTTVTDETQADSTETAKNIHTVYTFDSDGNVISSYSKTDEPADTSIGTPVSTNLLLGHSFSNSDLDYWTETEYNCDELYKALSPENPADGIQSLRMSSDNTEAERQGIYQAVGSLPAGSYTFSVYVKVVKDVYGSERVADPGAYISVTDAEGNILAESEHVTAKTDEYIRLASSFEVSDMGSAVVGVYIDGETEIFASKAQLENNPNANPYNILINGSFERDLDGWSSSGNAASASNVKLSMTKSVRLLGGIERKSYIYQSVVVNEALNEREHFTLSGWAKATGLPIKKRTDYPESEFRLRAEITYADDSAEEHIADFAPCADEWQFVSMDFKKEQYKAVAGLKVYCEYNYNNGDAYFDGISLIRNRVDTGLTEEDFITNIINNIEDIDEETEKIGADLNDETVLQMNSSEKYDEYGNKILETVYSDNGHGCIYRSFGYNRAGETIWESDQCGGYKSYIVNDITSQNEEIRDKNGSISRYTYDESGRLISEETDVYGEKPSQTDYVYDTYDNITEISNLNGTAYNFEYDCFHKIKGISVNGNNIPLISYSYKNGNGDIREITYANGDKMTIGYDAFQKRISETWTNSDNEVIAVYKYVYDINSIKPSERNLVRITDVKDRKEYDFCYENGNLTKMAESSVTFDECGHVVSKTVNNTVLYTYDSSDKLILKNICVPGEKDNVYSYEYTKNGKVTVTLPSGVKVCTGRDHLGRKESYEIRFRGESFVSQFTYMPGQFTREHIVNDCIRSYPTTDRIRNILFSNGRTIEYRYDAKGNVVSVNDSKEGENVYAYDSKGQLISEKVNGVEKKFTYDNYGNLISKGICGEDGEIMPESAVTYEYEDMAWPDKLTGYNGENITYDEGGNPLNYRGMQLVWEKGMLLKSAVRTETASVEGLDAVYTYNSDGIRTSKTINGVNHKYILEQNSIIREICGETIIDYMYDDEKMICGFTVNGRNYYFLKNMYGDIISVINSLGYTLAEYSYDAWGGCTVESSVTETDENNEAINIADINPFRYRGDYYDTETGLYYINSRYYDPQTGRFINASDTSALPNNLFL